MLFTSAAQARRAAEYLPRLHRDLECAQAVLRGPVDPRHADKTRQGHLGRNGQNGPIQQTELAAHQVLYVWRFRHSYRE